MNPTDHTYMSRALRLAEQGLYTTDPNPRVGCVLVNNDEVVGEGFHVRAGEPHAEVLALRDAGELSRGATAYVTLEPCSHHGRTPPCCEALIAAGVARVVAAMVDPNPQVSGQGLAALRQAGIAVEEGLMQAQAEALNPGFVMRMRMGRPHVRLKLAMSLDGRTAMASGESQWVTGDAARLDVQKLRARSSAILTGIGTVLADDPSLTVRVSAAMLGIADDQLRQPLRVVLDPALAMPAASRMLNQPGETLILTAVPDADRHTALRDAGAEVQVIGGDGQALDLAGAMTVLAARGINEVMIEAGATLAGAMLHAGLVDELVFYMAPHLMGDGARGLFHLPGISAMSQRVPLEIRDIRAIGDDWRISAVIK